MGEAADAGREDLGRNDKGGRVWAEIEEELSGRLLRIRWKGVE